VPMPNISSKATPMVIPSVKTTKIDRNGLLLKAKKFIECFK